MRRRHDPERLLRAVGRRARELRLARNLTQEALAERLQVATPQVQAIERGVRNLTLTTLCRLADALDVEPVQFLVPPRSEGQPSKPGRPSKASAGSRGPVPIAIYDAPEVATVAVAERRKPRRRQPRKQKRS